MKTDEEEPAFIAHKLEDSDQVQPLIEHLQKTAAMAKQFGEIMGMGDLAYQTGLYHDIGKYSDQFQQYIRGQRSGKIDHSTAGAQLMFKYKRVPESFCIAGHHAGIPDMGDQTDHDFEGTWKGRLKRSIPDYQNYKKELPEPQNVICSLMDQVSSDGIQFMLFIRMLFSCLVDADFLDTERYMSEGKVYRGGFDSISFLSQRFFSWLQEQGYMDPHSMLNKKRFSILQQCIHKGEENPGLFTLTVPTGGGKTLSSLAFAMRHAEKHHKQRIIYVIPYTSIIEQTADIFRDCFGDGNVVEHHMNVSYGDDEEEMDTKHLTMRLAAENWDAPVIVTTNVQFFESLFSSRSSRCRKLHNVADSVIVFDEAQMFPLPFLKPSLKSIEGLVQYYGCTAVLCSATQPHLERFFKEYGMESREIVNNIPDLYHFFKRTSFVNIGVIDYDALVSRIQQYSQVLCITLTKGGARQIYEKIKEKRSDSFYLSTDLCAVHRSVVINEIKKRLREGKKCCVISTSVISVGVDVDFPVAFLEKSGLDSLIQGAGRCNREGKRKVEDSHVFVFQTEKSRSSRFLKQERQIMDVVEQEYEDISDPDAIRFYFDQLYMAKEAALDKYELLSVAFKLAFAYINQKVKLIQDETKSIFIPYDEKAEKIAEQLCMGIRTRELMRQAGKYTVSVRFAKPHQKRQAFEQLRDKGQIEIIDQDLAILKDPKAYDKGKRGLMYEEEEGQGIMI